MKSETVRARVEPMLKTEVESVLSKLGLSMSEAIELYLHQIKLRQGIPFDICIPNEKTRATFEDTNKRKHLKHHKNAQDLFDDLDI
ncbi:MAG: type II toxin-antitoxin system RelB/DinJ family antitoxin [Gammaproteobacteria bacterium]|nr:type II toxin-antitoxin system RelB/DinJ family antitoxin [Gammaproteobacteria bacterium]